MVLVCTILPRKDSKMSKLADVCWISSLLCCYFYEFFENTNNIITFCLVLRWIQFLLLMVKHVFLVWVKSPFYLDSAEKHTEIDIWLIGLLIAWEFWFGFRSFEGWCTAANRDALSSTSSFSGGMEMVIKRTYSYKEVLR